MLRIRSVKVSNEIVPIGKVTVLVGPNNVGKSQFLRDILSMMTKSDAKRILVDHVDFELGDHFKRFTSDLMVQDNPQEMTYYSVGGLDPHLLKGTRMNVHRQSVDNGITIETVLGNLTAFKVSYLDASSRLIMLKRLLHHCLTSPPKIISRAYTEQEKTLNQKYKMSSVVHLIWIYYWTIADLRF